MNVIPIAMSPKWLKIAFFLMVSHRLDCCPASSVFDVNLSYDQEIYDCVLRNYKTIWFYNHNDCFFGGGGGGGLLATSNLTPTHFHAWIIKLQRIKPRSIFISGSAIFCFHLQIMRLCCMSGTQQYWTSQTPFNPWPQKFYQLVS